MFNVGSVQGYLKLNTSGWTTGMGHAQASLASLSRTMMRFGALAVSSIMLIEREFGKFDKAIRHATSVSETTEAQFKQMSEMALDASVQWNKAAADTAEAFYYLGSAGLTVTEQMQAFNDTIMLSRAMGSELSLTVKGMVDVVKAFGLQFSDSRAIADQLTKTVISSNQHFEDLDKALSYVGATARFTNNSLADTVAMLGIMANAGIRGSMAGAILRRSLANLMSPTAEMRRLIYQLGLNIYDATGKMRPYIEILGQISDALADSSDEYKNLVFRILFGVRAIGGQIALFNYGSEAVRKYSDSIRDAGGAAERVASKQMMAFSEQLGRLWQQVRKTAIHLGELLAPSLEAVAEKIRNGLDAFTAYIEANKEAVIHTMKWTAILGVAAIVVPTLTMLVSGLVKQVVLLTLALAQVPKMLLKHWKLGVLVGLVYALRMALDNPWWAQVWNNRIKPFLQMLQEGMTQTITQVLWELSLIPEAIEKCFSGSAVVNALSYFIKALQQIGLLARMFNELLMTPPIYWKQTIGALSAEFNKLNDEMREILFGGEGWFFGSEEERIKSYQKFKADLDNVVSFSVNKLKDLAVEGGKALKDQIIEDFTWISAQLEKLGLPTEELKKWYQTIQDMINLFLNPPEVQKVMDALPEQVKESTDKVNEIGTKAAGVWAETWKRAVEGVMDNMSSLFDLFTDVLTDIKTSWANTFTDVLNDTYDKARTIENILEDMFLGILHAFNRMVAEMLARRLMYQLFGSWMGSIAEPGYIPGVPTHIKQETMLEQGIGGIGQFPSTQKAASIYINVENRSGVPISAQKSAPYFDGSKYIVNVVMEEARTNPGFARTLSGE